MDLVLDQVGVNPSNQYRFFIVHLVNYPAYGEASMVQSPKSRAASSPLISRTSSGAAYVFIKVQTSKILFSLKTCPKSLYHEVCDFLVRVIQIVLHIMFW